MLKVQRMLCHITWLYKRDYTKNVFRLLKSKQHKYAHLSMSSYLNTKPEEVKIQLDVMAETQNFKINSSFLTEECAVLYNTNEVVLAYQGTSNMKDVRTDIKVILSAELDSNRMKSSIEVFDRVAD